MFSDAFDVLIKKIESLSTSEPNIFYIIHVLSLHQTEKRDQIVVASRKTVMLENIQGKDEKGGYIQHRN